VHFSAYYKWEGVKNMEKCIENYNGIEIGPIRPPSEADSLMLRLTRNCTWNQCKFCGLYKGKKFSVRPKEHIKKDIDQIKAWIDFFESGKKDFDLDETSGEDQIWAYHMTRTWYINGMKSIFLQDANSLVIKPEDMIDILKYLKLAFPKIERITMYGRSQTIARISEENLKAYAEAGLNRIHIGMETGSTEVLKLVKKGVDKETHIIAGQKVKKAGIELSEYFMPGLGGNEYSNENALDTADALNKINPDFIRIRTLGLPENTELHEDYKNGLFTRTNDIKMVEELLLLVKNLNGITSYLKSDHILNLLEEVEGQFPEDKPKMIATMEAFLELPQKEQILFRIGRRTGIMSKLEDLKNSNIVKRVEQIITQYNIDESNIDIICDDIIKNFI